MQSNGVLSIVLACRNADQFIEAALSSIRTYAVDAELIVVDGQSTDATLEILECHRSDISKLVSEPDEGIYDAISKGIQLASGAWIYVLGADDCLLPGFLNVVSKLGNPDVAYYGSVRHKHSQRIYDGKFHSIKLLKRNICHQAIFFPKRHWERLGGFDRRFPLLADYALNLKAFWNAGMRYEYVDEVVCEYNETGASATRIDYAFSTIKPRLIERSAPWWLVIAYKLFRFLRQ